MENRKFSVEIDLGNDALCTADDVARALRKLATRLEDGEATGKFQNILDDNGNVVGRWKLG